MPFDEPEAPAYPASRGYSMLSRLFTAVQTAPSGATARPVPLRTPRVNTSGAPPPGGIRMIVARCGVASRSSAEMLPLEPIEK